MKLKRVSLLTGLKVINQVTKQNGKMAFEKHFLIDGENQRLTATDLESAVFVPIEITECSHVIPAPVIDIPEDVAADAGKFRMFAAEKGITIPDNLKKLDTIKKRFKELTKETVKYEVFCLPGKDLQTILEKMTDETIEINPTDNKQAMLFDTALAFSIGNNFSDIFGMARDEFPVITLRELNPEKTSSATVNAKQADYLLLAGCKPADEGPWNLNGIYCDFKADAALATDGYRIHKGPLAGKVPANDEIAGLFIPSPTIKLAKAMGKADEITAMCDGSILQIKGPDGSVVQTKIDEFRYPDWKSVYQVSEDHLTIEKGALEKSLSQAMTITSKVSKTIKFKFNGGIDLEFSNPDRGTYQNAQIPIKDKTYGEKAIEVGMNGQYVIDALRLATKDTDIVQIAVNMTEEGNPVVFTAGDLSALVMPCRV